MRLLKYDCKDQLCATLDFEDHEIPPYAILSHTWGRKEEEVELQDIKSKSSYQQKVGYRKVEFCGRQAQRDGYKYFWADTCCIDKPNHTELSRAITSMYRWYQNARVCYVYLADVTSQVDDQGETIGNSWESSFRQSRWFTRGWTLQELLAPEQVIFYTCEWQRIGTKHDLKELLHDITGIPTAALDGHPLSSFPVIERMRWARARQTKEIEDQAYCLLGIFGVYMCLNYGEGDHAFRRLQREIDAQTGRTEFVSAPTAAEHLIHRTAFTHSAEVGSQVGQNAGSIVNHFYGSTSSEEHEGRAPKRLKTAPTEASDTEDRDYDIDKYGSLHKSLLFDRINFRVKNIDKALITTCEWLLIHSYFQMWWKNDSSDGRDRMLWIKGKPGCGKSTLMKTALDWTNKQIDRRKGKRVVIPYFFNARAAALVEKSSLGLYRTVVYELLSRYQSIRHLFMDSFAKKQPGFSGKNWTREELQGFLSDVVDSNEDFELLLFIDALDEAEYEDDVRDMITFLGRLSARVRVLNGSCSIRICLSSRHYPHISIDKGLSLIVEEQPEHGEDIRKYVSTQLTCQDGAEKDELGNQIFDKSARIFLWVVLVVKVLNKLDDRGAPISDMRARLSTIPAGLDELFHEILTKSDDNGSESSIRLFQWMLFGFRALEPAELFLAMEYSKAHDNSAWTPSTIEPVPSIDRLAKFILNCSRGLVEISKVTSSRKPVIQFIHETVREFLRGKKGLASINSALSTNLEGISHRILRVACFRCISTNGMPTEYECYLVAGHESNTTFEAFKLDIRHKLPFLEYAILHVFEHARKAQWYGISQRAFLKTQIDQAGSWSDSYRLWWNLFQRYKTSRIRPNGKLLYYTIQRGYLSLLPVLLDVLDDTKVNHRQYSTTLNLASRYNHLQVVRWLMKKCVDANRWGSFLYKAIELASLRNNFEVVKTLIEIGADLTARERLYDRAIETASSYGSKKMTQLLRDAKSDVDTRAREERLYNSACKVSLRDDHAIARQMISDAVRALHDDRETLIEMLVDIQATSQYAFERLSSAFHNA